MSWLRTTWKAIVAAASAALLVLAALSVARHRAEAEKWKHAAVEEKERDVADSVQQANVALSQAKLHNAKAGEAKEKARKKIDSIAKKDPELAAVLSGWNSSRLRKQSDDEPLGIG